MDQLDLTNKPILLSTTFCMKTLYVALFLFLFYDSSAQKGTPLNYTKQVGVSLPSFSRFIPPSRFNILGKNHSFSYRSFVTETHFFEMGTSLQLGKRSLFLDDDYKYNDAFNVSINLVYGKIIPTDKLFDWYLGVELINGYNFSRERYPEEDIFGNENDHILENKHKSVQFNFGPTLGVMIKLTDQIGFYIDGGVYTGLSFEKNHTTYSELFSDLTENKIEFDYRINVINSVMVFYMF